MKTCISRRLLPIIAFGAGLLVLGGCMSPTDETEPTQDGAQETESVNQALPIGAAGVGALPLQRVEDLFHRVGHGRTMVGSAFRRQHATLSPLPR